MHDKTPFMTIILIQLVLCVSMFLMLFYVYDFEEETYVPPETVVLSQADIGELAHKYIEISPYSEEGLVNELVLREKISRKSAEKAVMSIGEDWNEQALREAEELLSFDGYSEKMMRETLKNEGFTEKQTDYALKNCNADWNKQAVIRAGIYYKAGVESEYIVSSLVADGFTEEQALYGAENAI